MASTGATVHPQHAGHVGRPKSRGADMPTSHVVGSRRLLPSGGHDEHRAWAAKVWLRFDRDSSGYLSKQELDCDEFRAIVKSCLVPESADHAGGATYARTQMNTEEALSFYLRKADINGDGQLSFEEFESFTRFLRLDRKDINYTANLIFALFDLNSDGRISRDEFKEIYRYYLGHHPTAQEFAEEWGRLDYFSHGRVTREQYIHWLQNSPNPLFRQHAEPAPAEAIGNDPAEATGNDFRIQAASPSTTSLQLESHDLASRGPHSSSVATVKRRAAAGSQRPRWNQRFIEATSVHNTEVPRYGRHYFSRPQSLPELKRYYGSRRGFGDHLHRISKAEPPKPRPMLSAETMPMIASRHVPGGSMRNPETGKRTQWVDRWQEPLQLKDRYQAGTMGLRCPGSPPRHLYADLYEDEH